MPPGLAYGRSRLQHLIGYVARSKTRPDIPPRIFREFCIGK
jgi:tRNA U34 5-carboxymethylaminomethyl modifying GTPase MnmE/TrmE